MPGRAWRDFCHILAKFHDLSTFLVPEDFCPESLRPLGSEILENVPELFGDTANHSRQALLKIKETLLWGLLLIEAIPDFYEILAQCTHSYTICSEKYFSC